MPPGFTMIDNDSVLDRLPEIGLSAFAVYVVLRRRCNDAGMCWPAVETIAQDAGVTDRTVRRAIRRLVLAGMLQIEPQRDRRGLDAPHHYKVLPPIPRKQADTNASLGGQKRPFNPDKNDPPTLTQTPDKQEPLEQDPSNKTRKLRFDEADRLTAVWMFSLIQTLDSTTKQPDLDKWAGDVRLMRERDQRTDAEIRAAFQWANADGFWQSNILSPGKLREKFGTLSLKMKNGDHHGNGRQRASSIGPGQRHPADRHDEAGVL